MSRRFLASHDTATSNAMSKLTDIDGTVSEELDEIVSTQNGLKTAVCTDVIAGNPARVFGNSASASTINGTSIHVKTPIKNTPSAVGASVNMISYDSGEAGGNGAFIFGNNDTSGNGLDTLICARQFVELNCGGNKLIECNRTPAGVKSIAVNGTTTVDGNMLATKFAVNTTTPQFPLTIETTASSGSANFRYAVLNGSSGGWSGGENTTSFATAAYFAGNIWINNYVFTSSDERIKKNIVNVPDDVALHQLRRIPCRYYNHIDELERGSEKQIGFVAQEVKRIMPMAVKTERGILPNVYKNIECSWNGNVMSSTDVTDHPITKYRFYVSNRADGTDEKRVELVRDSKGTFAFDIPYAFVFCYGYEISDFHTVDYNRLHTLNFAATQEVDRIQQRQQSEIDELKRKLEELEKRANT